MLKLAVYPGTFDPITNGHLDVITRAIHLFDKLVVAVAENPAKQPLFTFEERIDMAKHVVSNTEGMENIEVAGFDCLTVDFAKEIGAKSIIRGLRAVSDFEFELQIALTNRKLDKDIESVFLMPAVRYIYLNSTTVKDVARYGGDILSFVPEYVMNKLQEKLLHK
ncbi:pantetheine-phosphate adenylyltransferase [Candidatus Latescibacterota bacterium]